MSSDAGLAVAPRPHSLFTCAELSSVIWVALCEADHVSIARDTATGVAPIFVHESSGENLIVVVAGANNKLTPADVSKASAMIANAKVIMCQNEILMESTIEASKSHMITSRPPV